MKKVFLQIFLVVLCFSAHAQKVSNIRAEQLGQDIMVFYSLETSSPCEVSLLLSQDNGVSWGSPLKNVSGDVGKNISAGEKQITWKVLEEQEYLVGDKMKFKVTANGRKSFEPEMVFVEGGTFQMGSEAGESDEKPVHYVTLSSFNIGKYEVTQAQWRAVMGDNPSNFENCDECPVESVSWMKVQIFIRKLNALTGKNYRLPTEAEWEYAAKGGNKSNGFLYSGSNDLKTVAWFSENSGCVIQSVKVGAPYISKMHVVGTKQANELGIHDMTGNVHEWCSDWFGNYNSYHESNPIGAISSHGVVYRGGNGFNEAFNCRISERGRYFYDEGAQAIGFRLVLSNEQVFESKDTLVFNYKSETLFGSEMVFVEGGVFQMGSNMGKTAEKPPHSVSIQSFYIGKHEVTQSQWREIMGNNPSAFSDCEDCPVETVSWNQVQDFVRILNDKTKKNYRLPTEAEWEYAARGGRFSKGYFYSGSDDINDVAWYDSNSGDVTHPVGTKQANELGIHDMSGNVYEWCSDWYLAYDGVTKVDSEGPAFGENRVRRGGSYYSNDNYCTPSSRNGGNPEKYLFLFGVRLVLPVE
jgi:formylglycine-generating enzyme required for sulfatase activity